MRRQKKQKGETSPPSLLILRPIALPATRGATSNGLLSSIGSIRLLLRREAGPGAGAGRVAVVGGGGGALVLFLELAFLGLSLPRAVAVGALLHAREQQRRVPRGGVAGVPPGEEPVEHHVRVVVFEGRAGEDGLPGWDGRVGQCIAEPQLVGYVPGCQSGVSGIEAAGCGLVAWHFMRVGGSCPYGGLKLPPGYPKEERAKRRRARTGSDGSILRDIEK